LQTYTKGGSKDIYNDFNLKLKSVLLSIHQREQVF